MMVPPARMVRAGAWVSTVGALLRGSMWLAAAGAVGAAAVPIAMAPDAFTVCVPPAAPAVSLPCLAEAGLGLAAVLGVIAGILAALSALARGFQERIEYRLLAAGVRSAVARSLGEPDRPES